MSNLYRLPFYARLACVLLVLVIVFAILYFGKGILFPLITALLFSVLVSPISSFLQKKLRFSRIIASIFTVTIFVVLVLSVLMFISVQIGNFSQDWYIIEKNIVIHFNNFQKLLEESYGIDEIKQMEYLSDAKNQTQSSITGIVTNFVLSFSDTLFSLVMIPVYMFLLLLYKNHLITFLSKLVGEGDQQRLKKILTNIKTSVQGYILGVLIQITIIATLTTIGLSIIGVQYALLLGVITGILALIPYLGSFISCSITIFASLTGSPDLSLIIWILIITVIVHLIDSNIIVPLVVSSKVKINALASIIGIFIGGMIAGIAGMFLAIPIIAILKVIFDNVHSLEPWGYLIGDDLPKIPQWYKNTYSLETEEQIQEQNTTQNHITQEDNSSNQEKI